MRERDDVSHTPGLVGDATTTRTTRRSISTSFHRLRRARSAGECSTFSTVRGEGYTFKQRERSSSLAGELSRAFNEITLKPEEVAPRLALLVALPLRENDPPSLYVLFPLSLFFVLLSGRMPSVADPWIGGRALRTTLLNPVRITCSPISRSYFLSFPSLVQGKLVFLPVFHACFPCNKQNRATHAT